jgi:hypothetical protein
MLRLIVGFVCVVASYSLSAVFLRRVHPQSVVDPARDAGGVGQRVPVPERISPLLDLALTRRDERGQTAAEVRRVIASELATVVGPCWPLTEGKRWTPLETTAVIEGDVVRITSVTVLRRGRAESEGQFRKCIEQRIVALVASRGSINIPGARLLNLHHTVEETIVWQPRDGRCTSG